MIKFNANNLKIINYEETNIGNLESNLKANNYYYTLDGKPYYFVSGEFQYARYENSKWADEIAKIKAGGVNLIATYCFWNCHEYEKGKWNFEGDFDLKKFVQICKDQNMMVILRVGPWCHAELEYGGFPEYIQKNKKRRTDNKKYLKDVKVLFSKYYEQVQDLLYPQGPIIGIQIENEYNGKNTHIETLKSLAIEVGFKVPFFTATAWPKLINENEFIPMYGRYPEAPWRTDILPIPKDDRFDCLPVDMKPEIGTDLIKQMDKVNYTKTPISFAELGVGNQVTNHRRPIISLKDAYAITFATISKGANLLGYYVYHGGRNPNFASIQETRRTGYPNDLPVISYDFQAPIGEYGYVNDKFYYLRLLHYMCMYYDQDFSTKQTVFPNVKSNDDSSYCLRVDENMSGYCFTSTYKRLFSEEKDYEFDFALSGNNKNIKLPKFNLKSKECFVFPFNFDLGEEHIDYILAQPFLRYEDEKGVHLMYFKHPDVDPVLRMNNHRYLLKCNNNISYIIESDKKYLIEIYEASYASKILFDGKKPIYSDNMVYINNDKLIEVQETVLDNSLVKITETEVEKKSCDRDLYDAYNEKAFNLSVNADVLKEYDDIKIKLKSNCDKAHIYENDLIVGDYMLYDGNFVLCTDRYKDFLLEGNLLYIKSSAVKKGAKVYYEIETITDDANIEVEQVIGVKNIVK